jgi:hypothetical protein
MAEIYSPIVVTVYRVTDHEHYSDTRGRIININAKIEIIRKNGYNIWKE